MKLLKRFLSWVLALTMLLGCAAQAEGFEGLEEIDSTDMPVVDETKAEETAQDAYVQFVCNPSQMKLTVISLSAEGEDSLSVKEKKTMLSAWDGASEQVSRGNATYTVVKHSAISGKQHAYALAEGMYFVRAEAKGYTSLNWTAVSVRYEDGPMEMKLNLSKASSATAKPAATKAPEADATVNTGDVTALPKDETAVETQRVVFWCDPAKMSLAVYRAADGEKMFPASVSGTDDYSGMDLVAVAEYAYDLPAGQYVYTAKCDGYIPQENISFAVADEAVMIDLSLKSEIRYVDVMIVLPAGQKLTKLYKASDSTERNIPAAQDGVYELAPGYYQCVVVDAEGQETVHNLTVSGESMTQTILLQPLMQAERAIQAVRFDKWQDAIALTVYALDDSGERVICEPDEDGLYHLPVGPVWYDASADGYVGVEGQLVQVEETKGEQVVRVWLLSEGRMGVNRSENVVIFAAIAEKSGAQPFSEELTALLDELGLVRADYFYSNKRSDGRYESVYYGMLAEDNVWFAVDLLLSSDEIAFAEPEYLYFTTAEEIDNPWYTGDQAYLEEQTWLEAQGVRAIWGDLERQGITPGAGVVVAVIDTGVDYTHPDLAANIWVNWQESGGVEGVDDDGNGYIDDIYGWNFVSENNNVKDDHGHGTHVAGIIAMADNGTGGVGLAYGSKVMAIKAGQASGTFSSSAIARAVLYAKANGADIINMSFGSYSQSTLVENALKSAYTDCLLVAAAGNDGKWTLPTPQGANMYPAAYSYVLGVMATDDSGTSLAGFSNFDLIPSAGGEYELAAPGVSIYSTLPGDRYARWSGTSMAAPVVSAAAAILMSAGDSGSRYVTGQLVGASKKEIYDGFASFDLASALSSTPIPELTLLEVVAFDDPAFDGGAVNNGDGVFQNGETIELGIAVRNRWGAAVDVQITASSLVNEIDPGFITWVDNTATIDSVGTFADADTGFVYEDGELVSVSDPLRFVIGKDVAHNVEIPITFNVTAKNGMDSADSTAYAWGEDEGFTFVLTVENGVVISGVLTKDTTLTNDRMWIIRGSAQVAEGVTLTVEAGTHIHFERLYTGNETIDNSFYPYLQVLGSARFNGTAAQPIRLTADECLAIVGYEYDNTLLDEERAFGSIYGSFVSSDKIDCTMQYVTVQGTIPSYVYEWASNPYRNSNLLVISSGDHLDLLDCRIVARNISNSKLQRCIVNGYDMFSFLDRVGPLHSLDLVSSQVDGCLFSYMWDELYNRIESNVLVDNCSWANMEAWASERSTITNNAVLNRLNEPSGWFQPLGVNTSYSMQNNFWGTDNASVISDIIIDSNDIVSYGTITYEPFLTKSSDMSSIYPFVVDAWVTDAQGNRIEDVIGAQEVTFHVLFNRDMNTSTDLTVAYGPAEPYNDYRVTGQWVSARKWEGTYQVNPVIDYGTMYIYVAGGHAADDYWLETAPDSRHWFEISNAGAEALVLQSWAEGDGIHLTWAQDDFETLAGYNLYRGQTIGEIYDEYGQVIGTGPVDAVKINEVLIPSDVLSYVDANVVEGETYHYYFTVVQTDFAESDGSNVTTCTALDMTDPVISHTPVASVISGATLGISATVTDNVKVDSVTLYARVQGDSAWTATNMTNTTGSLWYANVVVNGTKPMEYYISATDGVCTATCGTAASPMVVLVESGSATLGDVNADGSIDILDLMMMTKSIVGTKTLTIMQTKAADVNVDGVVDVFDLMKVAQYICGMIASL